MEMQGFDENSSRCIFTVEIGLQQIFRVYTLDDPFLGGRDSYVVFQMGFGK